MTDSVPTDEQLRQLVEKGCIVSQVGEWVPTVPDLANEVIRLREYAEILERDAKDHTQLSDLQHKRMIEATKLWQTATGDTDAFPDLGKLLTWLMEQIKELEAVRDTNRETIATSLETASLMVGVKEQIAAADAWASWWKTVPDDGKITGGRTHDETLAMVEKLLAWLMIGDGFFTAYAATRKGGEGEVVNLREEYDAIVTAQVRTLERLAKLHEWWNSSPVFAEAEVPERVAVWLRLGDAEFTEPDAPKPCDECGIAIGQPSTACHHDDRHPAPEPCAVCRGLGVDGRFGHRCVACKGSGFKNRADRKPCAKCGRCWGDGERFRPKSTLCIDCNDPAPEPCATCDGDGEVTCLDTHELITCPGCNGGRPE